MRLSKFFFVIGLVLVLALLTVAPAWGETRTGDQIVIGANEVLNDDLYVAGQTITIDGTVRGDVIGAGNRITVNGTIEGDLVFAGQAVIINGTIGDHLRAAGQVIMLGEKARVARGAFTLAFSLETKAGSKIGGDLVYLGYQALLAGDVGKDVMGSMAALELRGVVTRHVNVNVDSERETAAPSPTLYMPSAPVAMPAVPIGLTLADTARIGGKLTYTSRFAGKINSSAQVVGGVSQTMPQITPREVPPAPTALEIALNEVRRFIALLLFGLMLMWLVPTWTKGLAETIRIKPLPSLGWGIVSAFAFVFVLFAVLFATIVLTIVFGIATLGYVIPLILSVGLVLSGTMLVGFMTFITFIAQVVVSDLSGRWILQRILPAYAESRVWPLVVGLILLVILTALPWLGGWIGFAIVLFALGAFWMWGVNAIRRGRSEIMTPQMKPKIVGA